MLSMSCVCMQIGISYIAHTILSEFVLHGHASVSLSLSHTATQKETKGVASSHEDIIKSELHLFGD